MRPRDKGGVLEKSGVVEVVSSLERDGRPVFRDLRWGVYVVLEAPNDYAADCFKQYGLKTDASGRYAAMYKPYHLIGLELNISILSAALRNEPTGQPHGFRGDVAAVAKRDLRAGEMLDGEGGYTVWGKLMPARRKPCRRRAADRACPSRQAEEQRRPWRGGALERRRDRCQQRDDQDAEGDGSDVRRGQVSGRGAHAGLSVGLSSKPTSCGVTAFVRTCGRRNALDYRSPARHPALGSQIPELIACKKQRAFKGLNSTSNTAKQKTASRS